MSRYIDADIIRDEWLHGGENEHIYDTNDFLDSIDYQPTADVEPVRHAYPCVSFNDVFSERLVIMCSECGGKIQKKDKFCKHCGAKMDESVKQ